MALPMKPADEYINWIRERIQGGKSFEEIAQEISGLAGCQRNYRQALEHVRTTQDVTPQPTGAYLPRVRGRFVESATAGL